MGFIRDFFKSLIEAEDDLSDQIKSRKKAEEKFKEDLKKINSISETINSDNSNEIQNNSNEVQNTSNNSSNENSKDYEDIILNGTYAFPNSDVSYSFSKNGEATFDTNPASSSGTYKTTGKNSVEAHYTQSDVFNDETNKNEIIDIDKYEHFFVDDDRNVFWINPNGEKEKLEVLGEVDKNN